MEGVALSCGCRSAGECNHFVRQQWNEMESVSRLVAYARKAAMEELLHAVNWHIENGALIPQEIVEAARKVEDVMWGDPKGPAAHSPPPHPQSPEGGG